jgi:hypothetical protein
VLLFEDPATTSKIPALERPAFAGVAAAVRTALADLLPDQPA